MTVPLNERERVPTREAVVTDVDSAQREIEAIGGRRLPMGDFDEYGFQWRQMADSEGNEFCLVFGGV